MPVTRFGSEIEILGMDEAGWCIVRRKHETDCHEWHASELKFSTEATISAPMTDDEYSELKAKHMSVHTLDRTKRR